MKLVLTTTALVFFLVGLASESTAAVNLLYNFEGDSGTAVVDKLTADGMQNGAIYNSVDPTDTFNPHFGMQSAFFDNPPVVSTTVPPWSTLEIPDTTFGPDYSLSLAAWVNHDISVQRRVRVFSSFQGTGPVSNSLLLDFNNSTTSPNMRAIVNNTSLFNSLPVPGAGTAGYHHYAMTIGGGTLKLFFDGAEVGSGTVPAGYMNTNANLFVGEDPHNLGGGANEQLIGNVDDVLVLQRVLSPAEIGQIAAGTTVTSVVTPMAGERAVYYDFEGDSGTSATDKFNLDGAQNGISHVLSEIDANAANAKFGSTSYTFADPRRDDPTDPSEIFSQINTGVTGSLGTKFTISAAVNPYAAGQTGNGFARVLSSYLGAGSTAGQLILDFNPVAVTGSGIRLYLPSNTGTATLTVVGSVAKPDLDPSTLQTLTAVYDNGEVKLYLDGLEVASTNLGSAIEQTLASNELRIGEDRGGYPLASANENFVGSMDDVLILSRALSPEQVMFLHANGADALIATLPTTLDGDYNDDGVVDAADYVVWRKTDGTVDGYNTWRANFGATLGAGSGTLASSGAVPEPATIALAFLVFVGLSAATRPATLQRKLITARDHNVSGVRPALVAEQETFPGAAAFDLN